jgi:hypothetical protein
VTENREHAPAISSASCACISFSPMIPMGQWRSFISVMVW